MRMYVNQDTVDMRKEGEQALEKLFSMAYDKKIIESMPKLDFVRV